MLYSVAVVGASGYAGGELLALLARHPDFDVTLACAGERAGELVSTVHPQLVGLSAYAGVNFSTTSMSDIAQRDLVFLALPHGQSAEIAAQLPDSVRVVDLGADFRLLEPGAWERYYGGQHAGTWTYGLPELPRARALIGASTRVANPGCYATAAALALWPAHAAGVIDATDISIVAASGTTGAGRKATDALLASNVMGSMSAYKVGGVHQHTPEMEQSISSVGAGEVRIGFTPYLAPMTRGIIATCTARTSATLSQLREIYSSAYSEEHFIHFLDEGLMPSTASVVGTNNTQLQVSVDQHTGRLVVISVIDNLGKGAAGQAIQNANIIYGLPETVGLDAAGGAA